MTLKEFYQNIPKNRAPRAEFRRRLAGECKVSVMTIYRWLSGDVTPGALERDKISEITGIPVDDLFPNKSK